MGGILTFGTTARHNEILSAFIVNIYDFIKNKKMRAFQEQCSLVYWGERNIIQDVKLVNIDELNNKEEFIEYIIDNLRFVQPDFIMFDKNQYLTNKVETKFAGLPDLIVEVWSKFNTPEEKEFKFGLYSKSGIEHWHINQNSNIVDCWIGNRQLTSQSLTDVLKTQNQVKFDIRHLSF